MKMRKSHDELLLRENKLSKYWLTNAVNLETIYVQASGEILTEALRETGNLASQRSVEPFPDG